MAKKRKGLYKWVDKNRAFEVFCTKIDGKYPTLADVARFMGCSDTTIETMSFKYDWVKQRESLGKIAIEKFREEMQDIAKAEQYKEFEDWNLVEDVITDALRGLRIAQTQYLTEQDVSKKMIYLKALKQLSYDMMNFTTALKTAKNQKRTLLGMATDITKGEIMHDTKGSASLQELQEMAEFIKKNYPSPDKNDTPTTPTNT